MQFQQACPIDFDDPLLELVPENYLDQSHPTSDEIAQGIDIVVRNSVAFLIQSGVNLFQQGFEVHIPSSIEQSKSRLPDLKWKQFNITEVLSLKRGDFHSLDSLDAGPYLTVSRVTTNNGVVGYFDKPERASLYPPGRITVSTVGGDAFVQLREFIATDNVVICTPKFTASPTTLFFLAFMINHQKWRYSYGRQCYLKKLEQVKLHLPVSDNGKIDEQAIAQIVSQATYWQAIEKQFSDNAL